MSKIYLFVDFIAYSYCIFPLIIMITYHRIRHEPDTLFCEDMYNQFALPRGDDGMDERELNITNSVILYTKLLD